MSYNICYKITYGDPKSPESSLQLDLACFSSIFSQVASYKNIKVDLYVFRKSANSAEYTSRDNQLVFTDEEIQMFFEKSSNLFTPPVIRMADEKEVNSVKSVSRGCDVYVFSYDFTGKTPIYIKSALTYARYLFEDRGGFGVIVRKALEFSEKMPEILFIEIFAICHNSNKYRAKNSNHSLIQQSCSGEDPQIYTEDFLAKQMTNSHIGSVHQTFGFKYTGYARVETTQEITEEVITNFKRISC